MEHSNRLNEINLSFDDTVSYLSGVRAASSAFLTSDPQSDSTLPIVRRNLARIKLIAIAGTALLENMQADRALAVLRNRCSWGAGSPRVMVAVHNRLEAAAAESFIRRLPIQRSRCHIVPQNGHNETVGNALRLFRERIDPHAKAWAAKRMILFLVRRGGKGKPQFVTPFTAGQGTTCGEWTRAVWHSSDGEPLCGFIKGSPISGSCPVGCRFCYLQMLYGDHMQLALNLENLAEELASKKWRGFHYPINFGETGGLVECDEWFADDAGDGSMVQFVIDACARANVTPFFLTKIRYPSYLRFNGRVQVGVSAMPEGLRRTLAPHGSPTGELVTSLA